MMSRSERLLQLMQLLRVYRKPVTAARLASELEVSVRTIYRDIVTLQDQGAQIDGEPGLGYILRPGFMLPPLMFSEEEIEALVLGSRWVAARTDSRLSEAANHALAKVAAVLPADLQERLDATSLVVPRMSHSAMGDRELRRLREAIRAGIKTRIEYVDANGERSHRTIWPIAIAFFEQARVVAAWCEMRQDFRHFRTDRITALELTAERIPRRKSTLLREWRARPEGHGEQISHHMRED
jgi:predicted DNA-binding transcriptional regulator YafY